MFRDVQHLGCRVGGPQDKEENLWVFYPIPSKAQCETSVPSATSFVDIEVKKHPKRTAIGVEEEAHAAPSAVPSLG